MLGLCLCNVAFGVSGMALSAMSVPAHVCSFVMFIFGIALFSPFLFGVDYWRVPGTMFGVLPCGLGEGTDLVSACPYVRCTQISAGWRHTVLLRNDGTAVACGENGVRQCDIPTLADGMSYTQA